MSEIIYSEALADQNLRGKVVVLTGGAQGIGAATVRLLHSKGAHVFFGDLDEAKGVELQRSLTGDSSSSPSSGSGSGSVTFCRVDVRNYNEQLALFDDALSAHKTIDVAIQCAGVTEPAGWFEPQDLNLDTVRTEPVPIRECIEVNLTSVLMFCRIALVYLSCSSSAAASSSTFSKSIVLTSSAAGVTESPGLFAYSSAKHGVVGAMRALRRFAPGKYGVRGNVICPWATDTRLLAGLKGAWEAAGMPMNSPEDVAGMILQCAADKELNGAAVFVSGGRGYETERGVGATMPEWMGRENAKNFMRGLEIWGAGAETWVKS